jgi:predicted RNA methylase
MVVRRPRWIDSRPFGLWWENKADRAKLDAAFDLMALHRQQYLQRVERMVLAASLNGR